MLDNSLYVVYNIINVVHMLTTVNFENKIGGIINEH